MEELLNLAYLLPPLAYFGLYYIFYLLRNFFKLSTKHVAITYHLGLFYLIIATIFFFSDLDFFAKGYMSGDTLIVLLFSLYYLIIFFTFILFTKKRDSIILFFCFFALISVFVFCYTYIFGLIWLVCCGFGLTV